MEPLEQAKQPVSGLLAGPYAHPYHPALVTIPLGAWVASLVFDLASYVVADSHFLVQASFWLIALGVLGALLAAAVGFLDLFAIPTGTKAFRVGLLHMTLNLVATVAYALNLAWRQGAHEVGAGPLILSVVSLAVLGVAGYLGGELAFRYGVRVADEGTQAEGFTTSKPRGT